MPLIRRDWQIFAKHRVAVFSKVLCCSLLESIVVRSYQGAILYFESTLRFLYNMFCYLAVGSQVSLSASVLQFVKEKIPMGIGDTK